MPRAGLDGQAEGQSPHRSCAGDVQEVCSCSSAGTVTLAVDVLDQDEHFQDYVIVHELLHLRYTNHDRLFKALMSTHVPGWQTVESERADR